MKPYILKPTTTAATVTLPRTLRKPDPAAAALVISAIAPRHPPGLPTVAVAPKPRTLPPPQPLPSATLDPGRPLLKVGLDMHLESIMAVAKEGHTNPQAARKFTRPERQPHVREVKSTLSAQSCPQQSDSIATDGAAKAQAERK